MRSKINTSAGFVASLFLWTSLAVFAGETSDKDPCNWSLGSAYLLPAGRMEVGVFQPLRYGWSELVEISSHPIVGILMPNMSLKWSHDSLIGFTVATQHSIYYPSPLLRNLAREGIGGMISPEFDIPDMVALTNTVLLSKPLSDRHLLTGKVGFSLAIKSKDLDERTTIDLPLVFPRLAVFYHGYGFRVGGDLQGNFFRRWNYLVDADVFIIPGVEENLAFEHKGLILWNKSDRFQLCFGYKLCFGEYPFGTQWHLLIPLFDLQWAWQLK